MSFKLGLVGLGTSHPARWVPIIRELRGELDVEIAAVWDSGEVRPAGYAEEFCRDHDIPLAVASLTEMHEAVHGVILHAVNWDRHVEQARRFVDANQSVLIDKPLVGNLRDAEQLRRWAGAGKRITGGSSLRFAPEILQLLDVSIGERGIFHTALAVCGTDRFFYGIHGLAMLCGLLGPGLRSVQLLQERTGNLQTCDPKASTPAAAPTEGDTGLPSTAEPERRLVKLSWHDGQVGLLSQGAPGRLPLQFTAISDQNAYQRQIDSQQVYREFLRRSLLYLVGKSASPPVPIDALLEPELAALAALVSAQHDGAEIPLDHPGLSEVSYDGGQFAASYRAARGSAR